MKRVSEVRAVMEVMEPMDEIQSLDEIGTESGAHLFQLMTRNNTTICLKRAKVSWVKTRTSPIPGAGLVAKAEFLPEMKCGDESEIGGTLPTETTPMPSRREGGISSGGSPMAAGALPRLRVEKILSSATFAKRLGAQGEVSSIRVPNAHVGILQIEVYSNTCDLVANSNVKIVQTHDSSPIPFKIKVSTAIGKCM